MTGFIETAIVTAVVSATGFTFDNPYSPPGDAVVAIVSQHQGLGPIPAQFGWTKLGEVNPSNGAPRVTAYMRPRAAGDAGYFIFTQTTSDVVDSRAMGVLISITTPDGVIRPPLVGSFDGIASFAPPELFKTPIQVATAAGGPDDAFIWMVFDNTPKLNRGTDGFVSEGVGVGMPVHIPADTQPKVNLNFNVNRNYSVGLGMPNNVYYAGMWLKFSVPATACMAVR